MELKKCNGCGREFPKTREYFYWRNKDKGYIDTLCKECRNSYAKQYNNGGVDDMNNVQVINEVKIDWNKFKSMARNKGGNLDRSKNAYIDLCLLIHSKGHTLLSDYYNVGTKVKIDIGCGHEPIETTPSNYKLQKGNICCPHCEEDKLNQMPLHIEEQPKYNKDIYTIGFYNDKVDDIVKLCNCNRVFNDITSLTYHVRDNDIVELASKFSLYGVDKKEILRLADTYNIEFRIGGKVINEKINSILKMNEFICNNKEAINKLI